MDTRFIVLELVLHDLGIETTIGKFSDRIRIQKAIYLCQAAGVNLGYRFRWYLRGPYSPSLTKDYYELQMLIDGDERIANGRNLNSDVRSRIHGIRHIMTPPSHIGLEQSSWLELISSLHYLTKIYGLAGAECKLRSLKPHLVQFSSHARYQLEEAELLE